MLTISEYRAKVIRLFKSGTATVEQWEEMANIILMASETHCECVDAIDTEIFGPLEECDNCGSLHRPVEGLCCECE